MTLILDEQQKEEYISKIITNHYRLENALEYLFLQKFLSKTDGVLAYELQVVVLPEISFFSKIRILKKFAILKKKLYNEIDNLNNIRNKVAHDPQFYLSVPPLNEVLIRYEKVIANVNQIKIKYEND